jgi:hypothetical protein
MTCSSNAANVMSLDSYPDRSFPASGLAVRQRGPGDSVRSRPAVAPARDRSFILGRSDARLRTLVNQEERDRLHCWSMVVALTSSAAGLALLLTAALQ